MNYATYTKPAKYGYGGVTSITTAQLNFLKSLIQTRELSTDLATLIQESPELKDLTKAQASKVIDRLVKMPKLAAEKSTVQSVSVTTLEEGFYVLNGEVLKVTPNKAGTRMYAKRWEDCLGNALVLDEQNKGTTGSWNYAPGMVRELTPDMKMSLEDAKFFTGIWKQCVRCGAKLTATQSVEQGIGPICITYF